MNKGFLPTLVEVNNVKRLYYGELRQCFFLNEMGVIENDP